MQYMSNAKKTVYELMESAEKKYDYKIENSRMRHYIICLLQEAEKNKKTIRENVLAALDGMDTYDRAKHTLRKWPST